MRTASANLPLLLAALALLAPTSCILSITHPDDDDDAADDDDDDDDDDTGDDDTTPAGPCSDHPFFTDPGYLPEGGSPCRAPVLASFRDDVDGDTLWVDFVVGGHDKVRLIGVDTPELGWDGDPDECYGPEAHAFTANTLSADCFWLTFDAECTDPYDRLLAYAHTVDGFFQVELLERGYAETMFFEPNTTFESLFEQAEASARQSGEGLWGACY